MPQRNALLSDAAMDQIGQFGSAHRIRALEVGDVMKLSDEPKRAYG